MIASLIAAIAARTGLGAGALKLIGVAALIIAAVVGWQIFLANVRQAAIVAASAKADAAFQEKRGTAIENAWVAADERAAAQANAQALDRQRIEDAKQDGRSPFDALFPRDELRQ